MFRKLLLVSCTGASIAFSLAAAVSFPRRIHWSIPFSNCSALHLRFADGLMRVIFTRADGPVRYTLMGNNFSVNTEDGIESARLQFMPASYLRLPRPGMPRGVPMFRWRWVQQHPDPRATRVEFSYLRLPIWFPPLFFLSYPVASVLARFVRSRRPKEGCCPYCDYDLTGNLSGVCSECGLPIAGHRG